MEVESERTGRETISLVGAVELARQIARREVTVTAVVDSYIKRQELLNPRLNAIVENCWDEAREEAHQKDDDLEKNPQAPRPPFFGVPITVKEMISVAGMKQTLGSIHRRDEIKNRDASVVKRMRDAGAIVLGTTNVPELGFWFECENPIYGWTRNPYDLERTAGGSSGGEAAIIGAGASPLGLGSDVGGSIRIPAGFCGVFGHKPSNRIIPITGHYPLEFENAKKFSDPKYPLTTVGPLCRSAKDLRPSMDVLVGPDGFDPQVRDDFRMKPPITDWAGKTVWVLSDPIAWGTTRCSEEVIEAVEISAQYFESLGAQIRRLKPNYLKDAVILWSAALAEVQSRKFEDVLFSTAPPSLFNETIRTLLTRSPNYTFPALVTVFAERLLEKSQLQFSEHIKERQQKLATVKQKLTTLLTDSILLLPTHPRTAPIHHGTFTRPFDFAYTAVFNALGFPATVAPVMQHQGLPVSVQIVSAWGNDHATISAAEALEMAFGGWKPAELSI